MSTAALIIFAKNMVKGKVKTRLAATIGDEAAMQVYQKLVAYTAGVTSRLPCHKYVYFDAFIQEEELWKNYFKKLQQGYTLGDKMNNALQACFQNNYKSVVIIGTDCPQLTNSILSSAFNELNNYDVVLGPAADGGYYLIGMKEMHSQLFTNMQWSTANVCNETINRCKSLSLTYKLLPVLHDVDEEKDLVHLTDIT